jgi:two-component system phosphate regulon response regulator PhoB
MVAKILVVEDEEAIAEMVCLNLRHAGFDVEWVADGQKATQRLEASPPDLVLLDWMLPEQSGFTLLKAWRTHPSIQKIPIIMLTARGEEGDKISGLEAGADDYITKPFSTQELVARIRAILRRQTPEKSRKKLRHGNLEVDSLEHKVRLNGESLKVGPTEFKLLHYLLSYKNQVHSREKLLDSVWGENVYIETRTVDVHIKRLREALDTAGKYIVTVRGVGYKFDTHNE